MKKILAFSGSNHSGSINQALVQTTANLLNENNLDIEVLDLRQYAQHPIYSQDIQNNLGIPSEFHDLYQAIQSADGLILSTPEHNGFMPALLKNVIDWLSRIDMKFLKDTPVLLMGTSPGARGALGAVSGLAQAMPFWGAEIIGPYTLGNFHSHYDLETQRLSEEALSSLKPHLQSFKESLNKKLVEA